MFDLAATQFAELVIQESTEIKLGEIVELEDSKRIPLNSRDRAKRQGPYPYYGAASVMDHVDDYLFDGIRVLLGEDGTVITDDGHPVLQYVWGKYWVNNHAHVLKASGPYSLESIYIALAAASASELVTGAVQPKINQKNLRNLTLDMPSPGSLAYLETVFASYRASVEESRRLTELRDTLLPKLMSDEIDVSRVELTPPNSHLVVFLDWCLKRVFSGHLGKTEQKVWFGLQRLNSRQTFLQKLSSLAMKSTMFKCLMPLLLCSRRSIVRRYLG